MVLRPLLDQACRIDWVAGPIPVNASQYMISTNSFASMLFVTVFEYQILKDRSRIND